VRQDAHDISRRLRLDLTGSACTPLVLLGNFEVENRWAVDEPGLPTVQFAGSRAIVNRMDEFGLLLGGEGDYVVLKAPPDEDYLEYLSSLGIGLPAVLSVRDQDPRHVVTEDVLADPDLPATLTRLAGAGGRLWPHGVSDLEERLAEQCGLPLASAPAAVCKTVNSKIYSRLAAAAAGLRVPAGGVCRDLDELAVECERARAWLARGRTVVLKDAYGVSGKGILVASEQRQLDQVQAMCTRRSARRGNRRVSIVVEEWLPKRTDLNYQFTIDRAGSVRFDFVKEALTANGVHLGHRMPALLNCGQRDELADSVTALGTRLAADGYYGIVGVDALITADDVLYPVIEINARNNMSTYQERLRHVFCTSDQTVLAKYYPVRLNQPVPFSEVRDCLGELLMTPGSGSGLLVNNFATLNAADPGGADPGGPSFEGRLYGIVIAGSAGEAAQIDAEAASRLGGLIGTRQPLQT
jgi:hypothetical protein